MHLWNRPNFYLLHFFNGGSDDVTWYKVNKKHKIKDICMHFFITEIIIVIHQIESQLLRAFYQLGKIRSLPERPEKLRLTVNAVQFSTYPTQHFASILILYTVFTQCYNPTFCMLVLQPDILYVSVLTYMYETGFVGLTTMNFNIPAFPQVRVLWYRTSTQSIDKSSN